VRELEAIALALESIAKGIRNILPLAQEGKKD